MAVIDGKWLSKEGLTYFWSKIKAIFTKQTETNVVANLGAKNLFDIQHPSTTRSTTYNETSDGGVELSCSNAAWTQYIIADYPVESGRDYTFTLYIDAISGTDTFRVYIRDTNGSGTILYDSNNISTVKTITGTITPSAGKIWVGIYLNNSATAKTASAKIRAMIRPAEITDSTFQPYAPTNRELYETKTEQTETNAIANLGAKNLLNVTAQSTGIVTVNADGTLTVNGSSTSNTSVTLSNLWLKAGTYILSSGQLLPTGVYLSIRVSSGGENIQVRDNKTEVEFVVPNDMAIDRIWLFINANTSINNLTVYPMLRRAEITDATFEPYAKNNVDLTNENENQQLEIDYAINTGAKNLLKVASTTQTVNGVTFTVNDDQTITVNGTASATATYTIAPNAQAILIPDGNYILSGCPSGGGTTTYDLRWYLYSTGKSAYDNGSGASVAKNGNTTSSNVAIVIRSGVTANNLVFKPMIRPVEITDTTFQPYAPTNRELYETSRATMQQVYGDGTLIKLNADLNSYSTAGRYYATVAVAQTVVHSPYTSTGFNLMVEKNTLSGAAVFQTLTPTSATYVSTVYKRVFENGAWGSWYKFEGTQV